MSDSTPYEEELKKELENISFPDKATSWKDMQQLLKEHTDKKVPFLFTRNNILGGLVVILFMSLSVLFFIPSSEKTDTKDSLTTNEKNYNVEKIKINTGISSNNKSISPPSDKSALMNFEKNNIGRTDSNNDLNSSGKNILLRVKKSKEHCLKVAQTKIDTSELYNKLIGDNKGNHNREKLIINNRNNTLITINKGNKTNVSTDDYNITKEKKDILTQNKLKMHIYAANIKNTNRKYHILKIKKNNNNYLSESDIDDLPEITHNSKNNFEAIASTQDEVSNKKDKKYFFKNKRFERKINNKAKIDIINSDREKDDEVYNDTTEKLKLIAVGKLVLDKKKNKQVLVNNNKKDTNTIKILSVNKIADNKKRKFHLAIGIADQQSVRLVCDCVYPNDAYTKTSLVRDYIPSIYLRLYGKRKWFVQAEFKYAAPQYVQEQLYKNIEQNQLLNHIVKSYVLKKIYYNQVPISFNYLIRRNLSVGVGIIYNNLSGEVTQVDVRKKLFASLNDSLISSKIVTSPGSDSNFITIAKNSFQGLLQGQYEWKNFSFGIRYAIGLQSYMKYNDPVTGKLSDKKTSALNIFISYKLWDSKRKK